VLAFSIGFSTSMFSSVALFCAQDISVLRHSMVSV